MKAEIGVALPTVGASTPASEEPAPDTWGLDSTSRSRDGDVPSSPWPVAPCLAPCQLLGMSPLQTSLGPAVG